MECTVRKGLILLGPGGMWYFTNMVNWSLPSELRIRAHETSVLGEGLSTVVKRRTTW